MPNVIGSRRAALNKTTAAVVVVPPVSTPPNTLFGANLWAWYEGNNVTGSPNITVWNDSAGNNRYVIPGASPTTTTINSVAAVNFAAASTQHLTGVSLDTTPQKNFSLGGKTQITVWAVATFRAATGAYGGVMAYGSTTSSNSYDAGSAWLGVVRDNTNNALSASGGAGPAIAITPDADVTVHRFCTVWDGSYSYFYINNVLQAGYPVAFTAALGGVDPPTGTSRLNLGSGIAGGGGTFFWDGKVGEMAVVVDAIPTTYQLGSYDLYLKNKFGL